ncbi:hypothetical protein FB45DRAFT_1005519 [Roridomyces roridus]|uniref:Uncharacterized protein n=1 Tax=Roridomyces roridus TaxID=1738132 RepID=A0AAD7FK23_9AGAR|nr:hypothetical protein FB45DRAFT_1005519 [Roridomyces roridus]
MRASTFTLVISAILLPFAAAVPAARAPTDRVLTPGGFRAASNITVIPTGGSLAHVGSEIHVFDSTGKVVSKHAATRQPTKTTPVAPEETGWVADANWFNNGVPIGSFKTTWSVPAVPASWVGQTIFLFNSIEPGTFDAIMQPVLQYGGSAAGGGQFWSVATWYLYGDNTFFTTPVQVGVGQVLNGIVELVGTGAGNTFNYNSQFTNIGGTALTVVGGEELKWATLTLESYGVTGPSTYPAGSTVFSQTNLELSDGTFPSITWSTLSDPADGISTTVNTGGSTAAVITITY